jgi:hypothetical protein
MEEILVLKMMKRKWFGSFLQLQIEVVMYGQD